MSVTFSRGSRKASFLRAIVLPVGGFAALVVGAVATGLLFAYLDKYRVAVPLLLAWIVGIGLVFGPPIAVAVAVIRAAKRFDAAVAAADRAAIANLGWHDSPEDAAERAAAHSGDAGDANADLPVPPMAPESPLETTLRLARTTPAASAGSAAFFVVTLALFLATSGESSIEKAVILGLVLLVHELGHFAAMKVFGYDNPRIFFLPLFGAATSGTKQGGPGWQEVLVLLAGPLPGIIAGIVMFATGSAPRGTVGHTVATYLIVVNAFNLLPLQALDGGRVLNRLVFSRHPVTEAIGTALMSLAMMAIGYRLEAPILMLVGVVGLIRLMPSFSLSRGAAALRPRWHDLTGDLRTAPQDYVVDLHGVAVGQLAATARRPETVAGWMRALHERVVSRPVSLACTLALLVAYGTAFVSGVVGVVLTWR